MQRSQFTLGTSSTERSGSKMEYTWKYFKMALRRRSRAVSLKRTGQAILLYNARQSYATDFIILPYHTESEYSRIS